MEWDKSHENHLLVPHAPPEFPYFIEVPERNLTAGERAIVDRLVTEIPVFFQNQIADLKVVGRCGCGACPTVFFKKHKKGDGESEVIAMQGRDSANGLTAAVLLEQNEALSQMEFYSVDGHDPWSAPDANTLNRL